MGELVYANSLVQPGPNNESRKKRLALISRGPTVLPHFHEKAQKYAMDFFMKNNVELFMNTDFDETYLESHHFDHVI